MNIYYVFQNKTHEYESVGGYLWSPQKDKSGGNNAGYRNMSNVQKGDIIFHGANQETYAISIAKKDCYEAEQPEANKAASKEVVWNEEGYRVDSEYMILETPLNMREHFEWFANNPETDSAFTIKGEGKQMYLAKLGEEHAKYILYQLLMLPQNDESSNLIKIIQRDMLNEGLSDYNESELDYINNSVSARSTNDSKLKWSGEKKEKEFRTSSGIKRDTPKRRASIAVDALRIGNYLCEYDNDHKVFLRKNGKTNYTEPHHLIPMSRHEDFEYNLDIEENIVSLCSHCHNLLHYGRVEDKKVILRYLYEERKHALKSVSLFLDGFEDLEKYYK